MKIKRIKFLLLGLSLASLSFAFTGCSGNADKKPEASAELKQEGEGAQKAGYECPMKCEGSKSDKAGKCPACGMDLVKDEE